MIQFNQDLGNWNVSNVVDMNRMFGYCKNFEGEGLENWNVNNVKDFDYMFRSSLIEEEDLYPKWYK
jgi:hypothetical protein